MATPTSDSQRQPSLPVEVAMREAMRVYAAAARERKRLLALPGMTLGAIDGVPALVKALRLAERDWQQARAERRRSSLARERRDALEVRAELLASLRYLLRKNPRAQAELDQLRKKHRLAYLIQDLVDLARLVARYHLRPHLDAETLARAGELVDLLRGSRGAPQDADAALERRNRAFWALQQAVVELRTAGRYLFRGDRAARKEFGSPYTANKVRAHRKRRQEPPAPPS